MYTSGVCSTADMPEPVGRDLVLTRDQLLGWLRTKLPEADDVQMSALTAPEGSGFSNDTLLFDVSFREGQERRQQGFVARISPSGFPVFPFYDVGKQHRVMKIIGESSDVPMPRMYWNEEDAAIIDAPFFVMERLVGQVPPDNPPYHIGGFMTEIPEADRAAIWLNGLEVMSRIHKLDVDKLPVEFLAWPHLGATPLEQHMTYSERYLGWAARGKEQPTTEAALDWLKKNAPADEPTAISWGDSRIGNMMFRDCRPVGVFDWEMVALGNPEQDLAWWLFVDQTLSTGAGLPRLPGLPSREETVARYEELMGREVRHLHFYEVWAGFRFAVIMIRLMQRGVEYGTTPPEAGYESEKNNMVTVLLARLLGLPPPGEQR